MEIEIILTNTTTEVKLGILFGAKKHMEHANWGNERGIEVLCVKPDHTTYFEIIKQIEAKDMPVKKIEITADGENEVIFYMKCADGISDCFLMPFKDKLTYIMGSLHNCPQMEITASDYLEMEMKPHSKWTFKIIA